jgi:hypothetical protein
MSVKEGHIDFAKMKAMSNFTDESCMDFGVKQNLQIRKLRAAYPWYVNARSGEKVVGRLYSRLVKVLDGLDENSFAEFSTHIARTDELLHQILTRAGRPHYSIRYNDFTGVISTWKD